MRALTELHEIIRENQLKPLENIDRKKIALLALGSYFTRTTGSTSRLTTIPSYTATTADQNGAWNIKKHWQINLLKGELRPAHWGAHQTGVAKSHSLPVPGTGSALDWQDSGSAPAVG